METRSRSSSAVPSLRGDERFRRSERIGLDREVRSLLKEGRRLSRGDWEVLWLSRKSGSPGPKLRRLALQISSKVGGAVVRNRIRRYFRESFRRDKGRLPAGVDLLIRRKSPLDPADLRRDKFQEEWRCLLGAAGLLGP